jgi:hypothetical protein
METYSIDEKIDFLEQQLLRANSDLETKTEMLKSLKLSIDDLRKTIIGLNASIVTLNEINQK